MKFRSFLPFFGFRWFRGSQRPRAGAPAGKKRRGRQLFLEHLEDRVVPANTGAAGDQGGDIFNSGNLTLIADVVSNGLALGNAGGPDGRGGAIFNATQATLVVDSTIVTNGTAQGRSGTPGGLGLGGGIY